MTNRDWSAQQGQIFAWTKGDFAAIEASLARKLTADERRNLVVRARAGTGKTTTIVEAIRYAREGRILLAAFNKKIATELTERLSNPAAEAKTLHSVGYSAIRRYCDVRIDNVKGRREEELAIAAAGDAPPEILKLIGSLCSKAREIIPLAEIGSDVADLAYEFDLVPSDDWTETPFGLEFVCDRAVRAMAIASSVRPVNGIDFADMIFLPIRKRWLTPMYDLVIVDEAQDMTIAQLMIARGVRRRDGRIAVVGDDRQAIYGFRGADSGSLDRLKLELGALEMGLTTTYRCGRSIVELAAKIVPDYVAAESNPAGEVIPLAVDKLVATAEPGDFVLSRKNSPLTRTALAFLRAGKRAKIAGRDLGASMRKLVRQLATGRATGSLPALLEKLTAWEEREIKRAEKAGEKKAAARIEAVTDLSETLRALAEDLSGVPELLARIDDLFVDEPGRAYVVCSSVHRAKGLEAENVFVLADTLSPSVPCVCGHRAHRITCDRCGCNLYREDPKAAREEENIRYVAITRAKSRLFMVVGLL